MLQVVFAPNKLAVLKYWLKGIHSARYLFSCTCVLFICALICL